MERAPTLSCLSVVSTSRSDLYEAEDNSEQVSYFSGAISRRCLYQRNNGLPLDVAVDIYAFRKDNEGTEVVDILPVDSMHRSSPHST